MEARTTLALRLFSCSPAVVGVPIRTRARTLSKLSRTGAAMTRRSPAALDARIRSSEQQA